MPRRYHPDGPGVPTSFRLVPAVVVKIREAAKERQLPVAQIVTEAVEQYLAKPLKVEAAPKPVEKVPHSWTQHPSLGTRCSVCGAKKDDAAPSCPGAT